MANLFCDDVNMSSRCDTTRSSFDGAGVSNWDVSKVTDMSRIFFGATEFTEDVSEWDVRNVRIFESAFGNDGANATEKCTKSLIYDLWGENENFPYGLENWIDTSIVENCLQCNFHGATWLSHRLNTYDSVTSPCGDVSTWNTSNVRSLKAVFEDLIDFNGDISQWNISSVTDMTRTFKNASALQ
jgi:hypothetical protein